MAVQKVRHNDKWVYVQNSGGPGTGIGVENDPTVHSWAKQPEKPKYTAEEVGAATPEYVNEKFNQAIDHDAHIFIQPDEPVDAPVGTIWVDTASEGENPVTERQMQDYVGDVVKTIKFEETDPSVPEWAKQEKKPSYSANEISCDAEINGEQKTNVADALSALAMLPTATQDEWEFIGEFTLPEDSAEWYITEDADGNPIELKEAYFTGMFKASSTATKTTNIYFGNPAVKNPLVANCRFFEGDLLRVSDYDIGFRGIHIYHINEPNGFSNLAMRAPNIFTIGLTSALGGTVYKDCIAGLAMRTANAETSLIGAGSKIKLWGARV